MKGISDIFIILSSICMSSTAHVFFKRGTMILKHIPLVNNNLLSKVFTITTNPWVISGMTMHVCALAIWLWALSRVEITFAYPFLAIGFVLVSLMAYFWLGEQMPFLRIVGMLIIVIGIFFISKS